MVCRPIHITDLEIPENLCLMSPMYFIGQKNPDRAKRWWIHLGTEDTDNSLTVTSNLAAALDNLGADVSHRMYWDEGHGANSDAADFITWVAQGGRLIFRLNQGQGFPSVDPVHNPRVKQRFAGV